jgi:hypothetical protein
VQRNEPTRAGVIQSSIDSYGRSSGPQANDRGEFVLYVRKADEQGGYVLAERGYAMTGMEVMVMGGQDHPNGTYLVLFSA